MSEEIKKKTAEEDLNTFYNFHLHEIDSAFINIRIFEKREPNEIVGERVGPPIKEGQMGYRVQVKAKEALEQEIKRFNSQRDVLLAIEERLEDIKKLKQDNLIWQKEWFLPKRPERESSKE